MYTSADQHYWVTVKLISKTSDTQLNELLDSSTIPPQQSTNVLLSVCITDTAMISITLN